MCVCVHAQTTLTDVQLTGLLGSLLSSLTAVNQSLALLPSFPAVNITVVDLLTLVDSVNFAGITAIIDTLNTTIVNFPSSSAVVGQINLLATVPAAIPCLNTVSDQIVSFNESLFEMPPVTRTSRL